MTERAEFEKWYTSKYPHRTGFHNHESAWQSWQARAAQPPRAAEPVATVVVFNGQAVILSANPEQLARLLTMHGQPLYAEAPPVPPQCTDRNTPLQATGQSSGAQASGVLWTDVVVYPGGEVVARAKTAELAARIAKLLSVAAPASSGEPGRNDV